MSDFQPRSAEFTGGFTLTRQADTVFELFSPLGEKLWVPGWSPELLHPPGAEWERGLIFRTVDERGVVLWVVTGFDPATHSVEYQRLEPGLCVARVAVRCTALGKHETGVRTTYSYVGISEEGNAEIAGMTQTSYDRKMNQWKHWIEEYFARQAPREP